jgi:hypothetical protein
LKCKGIAISLASGSRVTGRLIQALGARVNDKTAKDRVREWLEKSGYPLEMEVAATLHGSGFSVTPSFIYTDEDSGKNREIDILATKSDNMGFSHVGYVIECKSTPNPWVVFISNASSALVGPMAGLTLHTETAEPAIDRLRSNPRNSKWWLHRQGELGYGLRETSAGQNDSAYSICTSLIKASRSWLCSPRVAKPRVAFAFPILVVDSPIFECSLNEKHEITLREVHESLFVFSPPIAGHSSCLIRIVTRKLLDYLARYTLDLANDVHNELQYEFKAWADSLKKPRTQNGSG